MSKDILFYCFIALSIFASIYMVQEAHAAVLDLTSVTSGYLNDGFFSRTQQGGAGSGNIDAFVRIQETGPGGDGKEKGYNTDGTLEFDTKSGAFTHSLLLGSVPIVNISGTNYREFLLDINEGGGPSRFLSLDAIKIHLESAGSLTGYPGSFSAAIYSLDSVSTDNWIKLDSTLGAGGGNTNMFAYIPNSNFTGGNQYVYFYSEFGTNFAGDGGFEEWAVEKVEQEPIIPEPASLSLLGLGLMGLFGFVKKVKI